jgi:hypothetical protein
MNAISLWNRLPYRAIHKRFIIWSNNYSSKSVCKLNNCNKVSPPIKHEGRIIIHPSEKCDISNIENEPNLPNEDFACDNICPELFNPFIFVHRGYV